MKSHCKFTVVGMDLDCPNCGESVKSGNRHECEVDGGISTRQTVPLEKPTAKKRKLREQAKDERKEKSE